jgi:2-amino-4-hydroxy-6-hydroxymethyldihydropteridine diphosphokinase
MATKDMILIALGSSLPICGLTPREIVAAAIRAVGTFAPVGSTSRLYASKAWPDPADPAFVNAVIAVEDRGGPPALIGKLHAVEAAFGRRRHVKNAPRTLDLDLLAYGRVVLRPDRPGGLSVPHPRLAERDFFLAPLCDIAPDWRHPATGASAQAMLKALATVEARPIGG